MMTGPSAGNDEYGKRLTGCTAGDYFSPNFQPTAESTERV
jgi:hypothetical protein